MPCFGGICFPDIIEIILGPPKHEKKKETQQETQGTTEQQTQTAQYWGVKLTVNGKQVVIPLDPRTLSGRIKFNVKTGEVIPPFQHEKRIQGSMATSMQAQGQASAEAAKETAQTGIQTSVNVQATAGTNVIVEVPKTDIAHIHVALLTSKFFVGVVNPTDVQVKVDIPGVIEVLEGKLYDQNGVPLPERTEFQPTTASLIVKPMENRHAWVKLDPEVPVEINGKVFRVPKDFLVPVDTPGLPAEYPGDTAPEEKVKETISKFDKVIQKVENAINQISDIQAQLVVIRRSLTALNASVNQNFTKVEQMLEEIENKLNELVAKQEQTTGQQAQTNEQQTQQSQTTEGQQTQASEQQTQTGSQQTASTSEQQTASGTNEQATSTGA